MAQATPSSTITLYSNIKIKDGIGPVFSTAVKRETYFQQHIARANTPCTYIRRTGEVKVELPLSVVNQCNYMSFVNPNFENRIWYCLIVNWEYENNECTRISYIVDPHMSYMFDYRLDTCMLDRQGLNVETYAKGEANPYDPTIYQFKTPEPLSVDPDLEKPFYTLKKYSDQTGDFDGQYMFTSISTSTDTSKAYDSDMGKTVCAVAFIAPIDFTDLDEGQTGSSRPSQLWSALIQDVISANGDYFAIDADYMGDPTQQTTLRMPLSAFTRGYNIMEIPSLNTSVGKDLLKTLVDYLTQWNAISQIVGLYAMPSNIYRAAFGHVFSDGSGDYETDVEALLSTGFIQINTAWQRDQTKLSCKKLYNYPFSYMRMVTPDENTKEYKYEDFSAVVAGPTGQCTFRLGADLNSHPSMFCAPVDYKTLVNGYTVAGQTGDVSMDKLINTNMGEAVVFDMFPQVPYITDAYLTFLAGQVMQVYGQNTLDARDQRTGAKIGSFASTLSSLAGVANAGVGVGDQFNSDYYKDMAAEGFKGEMYRTRGWANYQGQMSSAGIGVATGATQAASNIWNTATQVKSTEAQISEANKWLSGAVGNDVDYGRYNETRPAHANNVYHAGTNGGIYNFIKGLCSIDFKLIHVRLRDVVLQKYDRYFRYYGYNEAGRAGLPYVYNFVRGITGNNKQPHWETSDEGEQIFYVKTMDAHVTGIPLPYARYIEGLYNAGYRFINGDALIQQNGGNNG